jgi:putative membrane protein
MRIKKSFLGLFLRGIAMGAADVVPGVSGGTIAFITGIYEELIDTISNVNISLLKTLKNNGIKAFWNQLNGNFILALLLGIGVSIASLAKLITYLLETHPIIVWSFFFGLVLASIHLVSKEIKKWTIHTVIAFIFGGFIAYWITVLPPIEHSDAGWYIFISGMIAICAMILPGISGSFILLLLGSYQTILSAVKTFDFYKILIFVVGCIVGLLSFSRLLKWMFNTYKEITIAILSGFLLGSLNKLWPWKNTISTRINSSGEVIPFLQENVSPFKYELITNQSHYLGLAIFSCIIGISLIIILEKFSNKKEVI